MSCLSLQALEAGSQKEVANLKNLLAQEAVKTEEARKLQAELEESVLKVASSLSKAEHEFAEKEKLLIARDEKAQKELETVKTGFASVKKLISEITACFFGKPALQLPFYTFLLCRLCLPLF